MSYRKEVHMEFIFVCSTSMLHRFLTTAEGLKSWFCDDVTIEDEIFSFSWEQEKERAKISEDQAKTTIQYEWLDREVPENTVFEIVRSPLTRESVLKIKAVCDDTLVDEEEIYWNNIIGELKHATGG
ncbi:MAG TPA: hypothetical protein ENK85_09025 [Saprospiraceae bacterium]|nr:hypothetical protein [Saprospiraceae bacterium]